MIREDIVKVFSSTNELNITDLNITLGIGKGYNVCSFSGTGLSISKNDKIKVKLNDNVYAFIITDISKGEFERVRVTARGMPYMLENQPESDEILDYIDSNGLIEKERGGVQVINNLPNIDFKGKYYSKTATPMTRIADMVDVVGGEIYEHNSMLVLEELKSIPQTPTIAHTFLDSEVISFSYSDSTQEKSLIKEIIINPDPEDIFSEPKIEVDFDDRYGNGNVYFNPSLQYNSDVSYYGIELKTGVTLYVNEEQSLHGNYFTRTKAGIVEILDITIDEAVITNYEFIENYNVIKFDNKTTGTLKIRYKTKGANFVISKDTSFSIAYLNQYVSGLLKMNSENYQGNFIRIEDPLYYDADKPTLIKYSYYGDLTLIFKDGTGDTPVVYRQEDGLTIKYISSGDWNDTDLLDGVQIGPDKTIPKISYGTVTFDEEKQAYVIYVYDYIYNISEIVLQDGTTISYKSFVNDIKGSYITFDSEYEGEDVTVSYSALVSQARIPVPTNITVKELFALSKVENNIANTSGKYSNSSDGIDGSYCSIPSNITIDVVSQLNTTPDKCVGKTITGNRGIGSYVVDKFGKIEVAITTKDTFTLDCSNIIYGAKIFIDSSKVQ